MMLGATVVILREVLEAALLVCVLLALTHQRRGSARGLAAGGLAGLAGAMAWAAALGPVSAWWDGTGQEVVNALLHAGIAASLLGTVVALHRAAAVTAAAVAASMAASVALAITREGSEVLIYLVAFGSQPDTAAAVFTGAGLGAGIGASAGALLYWTLRSLAPAAALRAGCALLAVIAAGMTLQATNLLMQADWIHASGPVWNASALVDEHSVAGQVLYAICGYEATPTALQAALWGATLGLFALAVLRGNGMGVPRRGDRGAAR